MQSEMPLYPEQASNFAVSVDSLMVYITAICLFFAVAITAAVIFFFFKYRRKHPEEVGVPIHGDMRLETLWIAVPLFLALTMFGWGAVVYVDYRRVPMDTLDVYVIGKQWMWKIQQPTGLREINELHVPVGRVRVELAEDVLDRRVRPGVLGLVPVGAVEDGRRDPHRRRGDRACLLLGALHRGGRLLAPSQPHRAA